MELEQVLTMMDRKSYLSAIGRSAFYWSAAGQTTEGKVVYFDSSKMFK